ncbi:MAG: hypothetical protein KAS32_03800 [Candidatus Peribacteraceae bacterium]|nr:hypothetical protein [Candidatus Peribacteraceae bacterium]
MSCDFCLFKFNDEIFKDAPIKKMVDKIHEVMKSTDEQVYVKITGGEPLLKTELLKSIFQTLEEYKDKVYNVGIGSNGTIKIPDFVINSVLPSDVFFSRHDFISNEDSVLQDSVSKQSKKYYTRLNCNLIKGGIDDLFKIKRYIESAKACGVKSICFRELNSIALDEQSIYPKQVYQYGEYYSKNVIHLNDILKEIDYEFNSDFKVKSINGNEYDTNYNFIYDSMWVKFRSIKEDVLVKYNRENPNTIDEYVLHSDGLLTGCWDRNQKIISL